MTKLSDLRPTGGTGSGSGIKGNWDISPKWAPAYQSAPGFSYPTLPLPAPNSSNFSEFSTSTLTITSSIADITTDTPPSARVAAGIWNTSFDVAGTASGSYGFRVIFNGDIDSVPIGPMFGLIRDDFANPEDLDVLAMPMFMGSSVLPDTNTPGITKDYNLCSAFIGLAASSSGGPGTVDTVAFARAGVSTALPQASATSTTLLPTGNVMDCYFSWFDGGILGTPETAGIKFLFAIAFINGQISVYTSVPVDASFLPSGRTLVPFFGITSVNVGGGYPADITITGDYAAALTAIPSGVSEIPAEMLALILGTPSGLGTSIGDAISQVTTLPVGAVVNEQYVATLSSLYKTGYPSGDYTVTSVVDVDNYVMTLDAVNYSVYRPAHGFVGGEIITVTNKPGPLYEVKPFTELALEGDIIQIVSTTPGPGCISVYNEWRDEGGTTEVATIKGDLVPATAAIPTQGAASITGNTISPSDRTSVQFVALVDKSLPPNIPGEGIYQKFRVEVKPSNATAGQLPVRISVANITTGSREIEYSPSDFVDGINSGSLYVTLAYYPENCVAVHPDIPATAKVYDFYRKVTLAGLNEVVDISQGIQDNSNFQSYSIAWFDETASVAYISINSSTSTASAAYDINDTLNQTFLIGNAVSYNGGTGSASVTNVSNIAMLTEPATGSAVGAEVGLVISEPFKLSASAIAMSSSSLTEEVAATSMELLSGDITQPLVAVQFLPSVTSVHPSFGLIANQNPRYTPFTTSWENTGFLSLMYRQPEVSPTMAYTIAMFTPTDIGERPDPNYFMAMEVNSETATLTIKYRDVLGAEVSVPLTQAIVDASIAEYTQFGSSIDLVGQVLTVAPSLGSIEIGDQVELEFVPDKSVSGVPGFNQQSKIVYVQGTDFTITGTNTITFEVGATLPSIPGSMYFRKKSTTGWVISGFDMVGTPAITTFAEILNFFGAGTNRTAIGATCSQAQATYNYLAEFFDRPNPDPAIFGVEFQSETLLPTEGQLYTVPEEYDPTLNKEMEWKTKNALAIVKKAGTFNGRDFTVGNFARWNGKETVPFPILPTLPTPSMSGTYTVEPRSSTLGNNYTVTAADYGKILSLNNLQSIIYNLNLGAFITAPIGTWIGVLAKDLPANPGIIVDYPTDNGSVLYCKEKIVFLVVESTTYPYVKAIGNYTPTADTHYLTQAASGNFLLFLDNTAINKTVFVYSNGFNPVIDLGAVTTMQAGKDSIRVTLMDSGSIAVNSGGTILAAEGKKKLITQYKTMTIRLTDGGAFIVDGGEAIP